MATVGVKGLMLRFADWLAHVYFNIYRNVRPTMHVHALRECRRSIGR